MAQNLKSKTFKDDYPKFVFTRKADLGWLLFMVPDDGITGMIEDPEQAADMLITELYKDTPICILNLD